MALRGKETIWDVHSELCGDFKPYSPPRQGWPGARGYSADYTVNSWKDGAGVVTHPSEWPFSGYNEIQNPRERYALIDHENLMGLLGIGRMEELKESYRGWVEESLAVQGQGRQPRWTESIAVGSEGFVEHTKAALGIKAIGREVIEVIGEEGVYELREPQIPYGGNFTDENGDLRPKNSYSWGISA